MTSLGQRTLLGLMGVRGRQLLLSGEGRICSSASEESQELGEEESGKTGDWGEMKPRKEMGK